MIVDQARNHAAQNNQRNVAAAKSDQHRETESTWRIPGAEPGPHLKKNTRAIKQYIQSNEHDRNAQATGARGVLEPRYNARNGGVAVLRGVRLCLGFHHKDCDFWIAGIILCRTGTVSRIPALCSCALSLSDGPCERTKVRVVNALGSLPKRSRHTSVRPRSNYSASGVPNHKIATKKMI